MSISIAGVVKNGVVVPCTLIHENAQVEIRLNAGETDRPAAGLTPAMLRRMPREQRQAILTAAPELAEQDYRCDKEFDRF